MMQKMQQTLPIIPWMGGKRRLAKHLLPMFPEHSCYVELFSGGAALFFMRPTPAKVEVLNDITISTSSSVSSSGRLPAAKHSPACKTRRPNA